MCLGLPFRGDSRGRGEMERLSSGDGGWRLSLPSSQLSVEASLE